jgi:hypothetical protein
VGPLRVVPAAAAEPRSGVLRNIDRVSLALDDVGRLLPRGAGTPFDQMVVKVANLRVLLLAGSRPAVAIPLADGRARRQDDLGRAANRLFLALGDLRITARGIHDPRVRTQVLTTLGEVEALQWALREAVGLPHSLAVEDAIRHQ